VLGYALRELGRRWPRTVGNVLGYALTVAMVASVLSVANPYVTRQVNLLERVGTHLAAYVPDPAYNASKGFGPIADGKYTSLMRKDVLRQVRSIPGVADVAPYLLFHEDSVLHPCCENPKTVERHLVGVLPLRIGASRTIGGLDLDHLATATTVCGPDEIIRGRYLTPRDDTSVVVEEAYAVAMGLDVGDTIAAFSRRFKVVGIANTYIRPGKATMYAPIEVVRQILASSRCVRTEAGDLNIVLVEVGEARDMEEVQKAVQGLLREASVLSYNCYVPARNAVRILSMAAWIAAFVLGLAGILFAARLQYASVVARAREIGILKAIGWPDAFVTRQLLLESLFHALAGAVLGGLLAFPVTGLLPVPGLGPEIEAAGPALAGWAVALGILLALVGGLSSGVLSARRACKASPAEALRRD
jgi:putative ABC transport system permease protein